MKKAVSLLLLALCLALPLSAQTPLSLDELCANAPKDEPSTRDFTQAEQVLVEGVDYRAVFCTGAGAIYVDLYEKYTPVTVNNFVFLAQNGFYNNTTFHRVIENFMAQGGDPTGTGTGGPNYRFEDELVGFLKFDRIGLLAMANAGANTNGSQFFITTELTGWLNYRHTIFGDVLDGFDALKSIQLRDPQTATTPGTALETVVIVTNPARVASTFVEDVQIYEREGFEEALGNVVAPANLPNDLKQGEAAGAFDTAQVAQSAGSALADEYAAYLERHRHEFRVAQEVEGCSANYQFQQLGYVVDAFETAEDAQNALNDSFLETLNEAEGFSPAPNAPEDAKAFVISKPTCTDNAGSIARLYALRGRYLVTIYGHFPQNIIDQVPVKTLLSFIAPIFESELADAFRSELR